MSGNYVTILGGIESSETPGRQGNHYRIELKKEIANYLQLALLLTKGYAGAGRYFIPTL